ncbi:MAG: tRNA-guanine transglycosylase, partial [Deltaproteobacteria bacterium]|nr:tRNA-guanine transglycosylase [Deltaproteobacteria bacterium]
MSQPRTTTITTPHGSFTTPIFMPVGTVGSVKAVSSDELEALGAEIILGNTYHLMLRPGHELVQRLGGLHKFISWERPLLTDSGGYQVFSLSKIRKIRPDGVEFQSPIDGDKHFLTPELAIEIQEALGSDILMVLDDCTPYPVSEDDARKSMELTLEWAKKSANAVRSRRGERTSPLLFGIIQGSIYKNLRKECAERLLKMDGFAGFAIGGLSVGEP